MNDARSMTTPSPPPVLQVKDLRFAWPGGQAAGLHVPALTLAAGEHVLLLGDSGSGKSTLLGLLGGVLRPDSGSIDWLGHSLAAVNGQELDRLRADHIGFIFQQFNLVPYLSLEENVLLPCRFSAVRRARAGASPREAARQLMRALELPESAWQRPVTGLSVGQQQRAAAARALIGNPELLIADEPTSALDATNRDRLLTLLMAQLAHHDTALLVVSHDAALQPHFDRTLHMEALTEAGVRETGTQQQDAWRTSAQQTGADLPAAHPPDTGANGEHVREAHQAESHPGEKPAREAGLTDARANREHIREHIREHNREHARGTRKGSAPMSPLSSALARLGTLCHLAWRSAANRRASVWLTLFSVALSTCLLLAVHRGEQAVHASFTRAVSGTDLIVGARTSPLQLMLYAVFRLGDATHEISWKSFETIRQNPQVAWAIPIALGDSHRGFAVLATDKTYFEHFRFGSRQHLSFDQGKAFNDIHDVVLGAEVARTLGYTPGSRLTLTHGTGNAPGIEHGDRPFTVSGILAPTGTPVDRTLHISLEAMQAIHLNWQGGAPLPGVNIPADKVRAFDLKPEFVTAALVGLKSRAGVFSMQRTINGMADEALLAVLPAVALNQLWRMLDVVSRTLRALSLLVLVLSLCGLITALLASLAQRQRELAILRAVGARPLDLLVLLVQEGLLLTAGGALLGHGLLTAGSWLLAPWLQSQWGIVWPVSTLDAGEAWLMLLVALAGPLVALLPAWRASHRALADGLTPRL